MMLRRLRTLNMLDKNLSLLRHEPLPSRFSAASSKYTLFISYCAPILRVSVVAHKIDTRDSLLIPTRLHVDIYV